MNAPPIPLWIRKGLLISTISHYPMAQYLGLSAAAKPG